MPDFHFTKMHGAGNDFIVMLNSADQKCSEEPAWIRSLCDRKRGIGADGVIYLKQMTKDSFLFSFWNPDGSAASMCGNGLRCSMEFVCANGLILGTHAEFITATGVLSADRIKPGLIRISMPVPEPFIEKTVCGYRCFFANTGVPHAVIETDHLETLDLEHAGRQIRFDSAFAPEGTNVDFIQLRDPDTAWIRTYERGVEAETFACGTGVTAAGVYLWSRYRSSAKKVLFSAGGDKLEIEITEKCNMLSQVHLTGPAVTVFSGQIEKK